MWSEDEMVMISAIEHYSYCPRQCALIHVEQIFDENVFTLRGRQAHERTDTTTWEMVGTTRVERALPLWSERLGLYGRADTVEFQAEEVIYPVEYKHGPRRQHRHDDLQLCAQAACLEEMFGQSVPPGRDLPSHHAPTAGRQLHVGDAGRDGGDGRADTLAASRGTDAARAQRRALPQLLSAGCLRALGARCRTPGVPCAPTLSRGNLGGREGREVRR